MLPSNVRKAIFDRPLRRRVVKPGSASVSVVVRLNVDPERIRKISPRDRQLNLTQREMTCLDPIQTTLFGNLDQRRTAKLIINRRGATLLSVSSTGILVFSNHKIGGLS